MKTRTKSDECASWMLHLLADIGPLKPQEVVELGKKAGYNRSMVFRVRDRLAGQIVDVHGHMHPGNLWQLETTAALAPRRRSAEDQIAALNDWMAENVPDIYWSTGGLDTAQAVIFVLETQPSRDRLVLMLARELNVDVSIL